MSLQGTGGSTLRVTSDTNLKFGQDDPCADKNKIGASVSQAFPPLGPEFEPFLFAVVCNEGNGMPLTTLSAIARSGADPWREASRIASLPKAAALDVLARMIPDGAGADGAAITSRLFALLPVARPKLTLPVVSAQKDAAYGNPVVLGIIVLVLCLSLFFAFRKTDHSGAAPSEPPSPAQAADKVER